MLPSVCWFQFSGVSFQKTDGSGQINEFGIWNAEVGKKVIFLSEFLSPLTFGLLLSAMSYELARLRHPLSFHLSTLTSNLSSISYELSPMRH